MKFETVLIILNFSLVIPAIMLLFKIGYSMKKFWPFIVYIIAGLCNDIVSYVLIMKTQTNMITANIYIFIEFCLILFQVALWKKQPVWHYLLIVITGIFVWVLDNVYLNSLTDNNSIFRMFYSITIVLLSLDLFNRNIIYARGPLSSNPVFLICTGFILYYGCKAFLESFNIFHVGLSDLFFMRLFLILSVVNFVANLIYAYAILCIPRKQEFTMPY